MNDLGDGKWVFSESKIIVRAATSHPSPWFLNLWFWLRDNWHCISVTVWDHISFSTRKCPSLTGAISWVLLDLFSEHHFIVWYDQLLLVDGKYDHSPWLANCLISLTEKWVSWFWRQLCLDHPVLHKVSNFRVGEMVIGMTCRERKRKYRISISSEYLNDHTFSDRTGLIEVDLPTRFLKVSQEAWGSVQASGLYPISYWFHLLFIILFFSLVIFFLFPNKDHIIFQKWWFSLLLIF